MVWWMNPKYSAYLWKLSQWKGEPLSFYQRYTNWQKYLKSNLGIADFIEVDFVISISTNLEYSSIATSNTTF